MMEAREKGVIESGNCGVRGFLKNLYFSFTTILNAVPAVMSCSIVPFNCCTRPTTNLCPGV